MDAKLTMKSHLRDDETGEQLSAHIVFVSDFDMPFISMVFFMLKLTIAAIPAALILVTAAHFVGMIFGAVNLQ